MKIMLKGYEKLRLIETVAYQLNDVTETTQEIAQTSELEHEVITGTLRLVYKAFQREWDDEFTVVESGEDVGFKHVGLDLS
ncbi:DUF1638 domain-containing protein [Desulfosporosinus orientis]|uniref:DUF1638 domain-containing protein n=1 Tax=Desulfosporosinus orientis TaxID=1563 RepID=UPI000694658E|nr:DUF1638 domain-containing protein [Desulfosporosinus orientis]